MPKFSKYSKIFEPIECGPMTLKNRIQFTPLVSCHARANGEVTTELVEFIGGQARTGVGLITIGDTAVDRENGDGFLGAMSMVRDTDIMGLSRLSEEAHKYGCKLSVEINHAGNSASTILLEGEALGVTSSPMQLPDKPRIVKPLDQADIDKIITQFADCAERLMKSGFDAVMLHAAHGNLITQFLSPLTNTRNDWYGGSLENRCRFPLQILEAIRERCGNKIAIDCRISDQDRLPGGTTIEDTIYFIKQAEKYLDMVHISTAHITDMNCIKWCLQPSTIEHNINVDNAARIKKELNIPVTVVGSISTLEDAEKAIASGKVDMVGMARALLVDGYTVTKGYRGEDEKIRPCIRCYNCLKEIFPGKHVRCSLNPVVGQEYKYKHLGKSCTPKKVMIIGGGPAGMEAAQIATERGHDVTVYEKADKLGGLLHEATALEMKADLKKYVDWMINTTLNCGAKIELNQEVTVDFIEKINPDAVILATGAVPFIPPIEGSDRGNISLVTDVDCGVKTVGQNVVICGGGLSGTESAIELAKQGKNVTIVDMQSRDELCQDVFLVNRIALMDLLAENNVKVIDQVKIEKFSDNGVEIIDKNWNRSAIACDDVVIALGLKPTFNTVRELSEVIPETYVVGDCVKPKDIHNAIHSAFHYAMEL